MTDKHAEGRVMKVLVGVREVAPTLSLLAVPSVVAYMQYQAAEAAVRQQYVALAIGLLQKPAAADDKAGTDRNLRLWAVDVINASAPVKLSGTLRDRLADGETWLRGSVWIYDMHDMKKLDSPPQEQQPPPQQPPP